MNTASANSVDNRTLAKCRSRDVEPDWQWVIVPEQLVLLHCCTSWAGKTFVERISVAYFYLYYKDSDQTGKMTSITKTLIRLGRCPGWSESLLGAQSFCWFCLEAAHFTFQTFVFRFFVVRDGWLFYYPDTEKKDFTRRNVFNTHPKVETVHCKCDIRELKGIEI